MAQVERNLHDAMGVARNVMLDPRLVPGGGAVEMAISRGLCDRAALLQGVEQVCACSLCTSLPYNLWV
jgi:T-complex protein 1 subunit gamma